MVCGMPLEEGDEAIQVLSGRMSGSGGLGSPALWWIAHYGVAEPRCPWKGWAIWQRTGETSTRPATCRLSSGWPRWRSHSLPSPSRARRKLPLCRSPARSRSPFLPPSSPGSWPGLRG